MNKKQYKLFITDFINYWSKRLKIGKIYIKENNEMWYLFNTRRYTSGNYWLHINYKVLLKDHYTKNELIFILFHELGHYKYDNFHNSYPKEYGAIMSEYIAESRAWKWTKKYYPKVYKKFKNTRAKLWIKSTLKYPKRYSFYFLAFSQIPEYANIIDKEL